jgi:SAM-dependent methyltransferase
MDTSCPVCSVEVRLIGVPYLGLSELFKDRELVKCPDCGLVFCFPEIDSASLEKYNKDYFHNAHNQEALTKDLESYFSSIAVARQNYILKYIDPSCVNSVLEIGPGHGIFAKKWMSSFGTKKYSALESDKKCVDLLEKLGVKVIDWENLIAHGKSSFDLIVMSHVLEHLNDPKSLLSNINNLSKYSGFIFIEVPCLDYIYKTSYEPHIFFYDKKSMRNLLESAGYSIVHLGYFGQTFDDIVKPSFWSLLRQKILKVIIKVKFYYLELFSWRGGMMISYELSMIKLFEASIEQNSHARWLRVIARKGCE